jgi:hypothetical protein
MLLNNSSLYHITLQFLSLSHYRIVPLTLTLPYNSSLSLSHYPIALLTLTLPYRSSHSHITLPFLLFSHYPSVPLTITLPINSSPSRITQPFFHPHLPIPLIVVALPYHFCHIHIAPTQFFNSHITLPFLSVTLS